MSATTTKADEQEWHPPECPQVKVTHHNADNERNDDPLQRVIPVGFAVFVLVHDSVP
jgi:hypothetical protein